MPFKGLTWSRFKEHLRKTSPIYIVGFIVCVLLTNLIYTTTRPQTPADREVLVYLGQEPEQTLVTVPDFTGMNRQQAADAAGKLGLYLLVTGNDEISQQVTVTAQSEPKDSQVPLGTTITLTFADLTARD